ncbi:hypothetical protein KBTX_02194 [wastewater metagenome]|uniref:CRISPR-associated endonuclease/helicase Cas3 n=3 Tax=root TaxID=1 RepID=A0A5B8RB05_9ZZZZ|nr:hypothetical protein KBTEX_02194 [uncultured organism]
MNDYTALFRQAMNDQGLVPYPYQHRLVDGPWPDLLNVPTGLGKTAAISLAWAYRRGVRAGGERTAAEPGIPRRLVWCLPMRVLVEQTVDNARAWLSRLGVLGAPGEEGKVTVHTLMGGEPELKQASWASNPEQEAILVGTQDMLLSRALMRGYGMSRYQWPVHYALLHNDAQWIFDEVQLMGPALPTSTQLEAFRRTLHTAAPARSTWVSATLREDWLDTVDFRGFRREGLERIELTDSDQETDGVTARIHAPKALKQTRTCLTKADKKGQSAYIGALAEEIAAAHAPGEQTLVIINRVERAQALYDALADHDAERLLLHARFRPAERARIEARLREPPASGGRIVVATQAVEAGVDLDSRVLFTELAPWASLVQRFGRCNRAGRFDDARVHWVDLDEENGDLVLPYEATDLAHAREQLNASDSAAPADLPPVTGRPGVSQVLRRRDLLDLFNTDPDLSGFDVDVSPYIRNTGTPPVHVFWRDADRTTAATQDGPSRDELCPVSLPQLREHLDKRLPGKRRKATGRDQPLAWYLNPLAGDVRGGAWEPLRSGMLRPGQVVMLCAADGGYDVDRGFRTGTDAAVPPVATPDPTESVEGYGSDPLTYIGRPVTLPIHLADTAAAMGELAAALRLPEHERNALVTAARWHDVGKAHEAFQRGIGAAPEDDPGGPWAKSGHSDLPRYHTIDEDGETHRRPGFRHELASALAWLAHAGDKREAAERDLVAYLIAAHHGRVRMGLRALPEEREPPGDGTLYARGVWAGDTLPSLAFDGEYLEPVTLELDLMRLGKGPQGPSWSERTHRLLDTFGPFRLAWQESLVRIADWRASRRESQGETT